MGRQKISWMAVCFLVVMLGIGSNAGAGVLENDLNGNDRIGLDDAVLSLQIVGGIRSGQATLLNTIAALQVVAGLTIEDVNQAPVIDLDVSDTATFNYSTTYSEGTSPVTVSNSDAEVTDTDDTHMVSMTVTVADDVDGSSEVVNIGGTDFPLDTTVSTPATVTYGATNFDITYDAGTGVFTVVEEGGDAEMPIGDLNLLIRGMTYENTSGTPTVGNRILSFVTTDGDDNSNTAVSTVTVSQNAPPVIELSDQNLHPMDYFEYNITEEIERPGSVITYCDVIIEGSAHIWLIFTESTHQFRYIPGAYGTAEPGTYNVSVTVTYDSGLTASGDFNIIVSD